MAIFELFSRRKKRAAGGFTDVYQYEKFPMEFKVQITQMWDEILTPESSSERTYEQICKILRKEYARFCLLDNHRDKYADDANRLELFNFFIKEDNIDYNMDVLELVSKYIHIAFRKVNYIYNEKADEYVSELNTRAKEHGFGYEFVEGQMIRIDSEIVHKEAVIPVLAVFKRGGFDSAQDEFLDAHEHYRHKRYTESLVECLKSFESTMKIICDRRKWNYDKTKGAKELIRACIDNGLIPQYWSNHFSGLRSTLESGIPTPRNKIGGHGAGSEPTPQPPEELIAYVLHMTASTILFLTEADSRIK